MRVWIAVVVGALGCSKGPSAMEVCKQIEATGVASGCKSEAPNGLGAGAKEAAVFDLTHVSGKTGQVLKFDDGEAFTRAVASFDAAAMLAGPHRFGSKKSLVFVQMNDGASAEDSGKVRAVVGALGDLVAPPAPTAEPAKVAKESKAPEPAATPEPAAAPSGPAMLVCEKIAAIVAATSKCTLGPTGRASLQDSHAKVLVSVPDAAVYEAVLKGLTASKTPGQSVAGSKSTGAIVMWSSDSPDLDKKIRAAL